jgi:hypothetical protein
MNNNLTKSFLFSSIPALWVLFALWEKHYQLFDKELVRLIQTKDTKLDKQGIINYITYELWDLICFTLYSTGLTIIYSNIPHLYSDWILNTNWAVCMIIGNAIVTLLKILRIAFAVVD